MIPDFTEEGFLPPGIHLSTIEKFQERFATNMVRKQIFAGLLRLMADLKRVDCKNIFVDGSFVTKKEHPNDIDVCWDDRGMDYDKVEAGLPILWDLTPPRKKQQTVYRADVFPAFIEERGSGKFFIDFFQQVKGEEHLKKGIIQLPIT
ncbi:DUF6932 family protein [Pedobacter frigidisoli]|uniref:DUF6932 family protein n=1 Tax=Pedobacter frigidisoli TaxID=2530455 RepID=UPI00292CCFB1|nr:hypothetical protein [Pedobacter frigidisoli]